MILSDDDCSWPCAHNKTLSCMAIEHTAPHRPVIVESISAALYCPSAVMAVPHRDPPSTKHVRSVGCLSLKDVAENACPYRLCIGVHHGLSVFEPHEQCVASPSNPACAYANNVQDHACCVDQTPNSRCLISLHSLNCARSSCSIFYTEAILRGKRPKLRPCYRSSRAAINASAFWAPTLFAASF